MVIMYGRVAVLILNTGLEDHYWQGAFRKQLYIFFFYTKVYCALLAMHRIEVYFSVGSVLYIYHMSLLHDVLLQNRNMPRCYQDSSCLC